MMADFDYLRAEIDLPHQTAQWTVRRFLLTKLRGPAGRSDLRDRFADLTQSFGLNVDLWLSDFFSAGGSEFAAAFEGDRSVLWRRFRELTAACRDDTAWAFALLDGLLRQVRSARRSVVFR